jgi:alpha-tubulin suppressor-like RCC1 family protein
MPALAKTSQRKWLRQNVAILGVMMLVLAAMSVAYAAMSSDLQIKGEAVVKETAPARIVNVQPTSPNRSCGIANYPPTWEDARFQVDGLLPALDCVLKFDITVRNDSDELMYVSKITEEAFNNSSVMKYSFSISPGAEQAVVPAGQELTFTLEFSYQTETLPSQTDFSATFSLILTKNTPPVLTASNSSRHFEIFRGDTSFTPDSLAARVSALDDLDGDITSKITRQCSGNGQTVACPSDWSGWARGDYSITYGVTNSLGLAAQPITMNVKLWDFVKLDGGEEHTMALSSHGLIWIWGHGNVGRVGTGAGITSDQLSPAYRSNLTGDFDAPARRIVDMAANYTSSYAVDDSGDLWAWGNGSYYALGNNNTSIIYAPTKIALPAGVKAVQVSGYHHTGMIRAADGEVYAWGDRNYGANTTNVNMPTPTKVANLPAVKHISVGYYSGAAIDMDGNLWTWGRNNSGQLGAGFSGAGTTATSKIRVASTYNAPNKYSGLTGVKDVAVAESHVIALMENGDVYVWGGNYYGRVCNGSSLTNAYVPFVLSRDGAGIAIHMNSSHFNTTDGKAYSCGGNTFGEIQTGSTNPTAVTSPVANYQFNSGITYIEANTNTSHVLLNNIEVWGYGASDYGQVGFGGTGNIPSGRRWNFSAPVVER